MRELSIDIETYSSVDLIKSGVYPYVEAPDFTILLFAYAFDDDPVTVIDLTCEHLPDEIIGALHDKNIIKTAYNANFERVCLSRYLNDRLPVHQWRCTAVHASMLGLPGSLGQVAKVLQLTEGKMDEGKNLIKYFSIPCKPTKINGGRTRNLPEHAPDKWEIFKDYCKRDVEVERTIKQRIKFYEVPDSEWRLWFLDQKINDTGVLIDMNIADNAIACNEYFSEKLMEEAKLLTGLNNPNSTAQIKKWLEEKIGKVVQSISKENVDILLETTKNTDIKRLLEIRKEMSKTSVKKYTTMKTVVCDDGCVKGLLQFYGANRTGRWGGRLLQPHNLPKNYLKDLDLARQLLASGRFEEIEMLYGSPADVMSQLIRTAFIAGENKRFIVADFSAIEARVISWFADERWRLDVFATHGKIYEASAAQMFKVPIESITKGSPLRQKGKAAELALGYQGGPPALINQGALKNGLTEDELPDLVDSWRNANKKIVKFWYDIERAAKRAIKEKTCVSLHHGLKFIYGKGILFIELPSGRRLSYLKAHVDIGGAYERETIFYEGTGQTSKNWVKQDTYGGKLVENIVQATARDCLAEAMIALDAAGYKIVMHVHDEVVIECENGRGGLKEVGEIMGRELSWAKGLPLRADAYETPYYMKD